MQTSLPQPFAVGKINFKKRLKNQNARDLLRGSTDNLSLRVLLIA